MSAPLGLAAPLLASLLLAAGTPTAPKAPAPPPGPIVVEVRSVEPEVVRVGKSVTITGIGLLHVEAVLFGGYAALVVEHTDTRIVFKAPADPHYPDGYAAVPFLLIPGQPVARAGSPVAVRPHAIDADVPSALRAETVLSEESVELSKAASKSLEVAVPDAGPITLEVETADRTDVTVRVEALDPPGPGTFRVSSAGRLRWRVSGRDLYGSRAAQRYARKLSVTVSSDSALPVSAKVSVKTERTGAGKPTPVPTPR